MCNLPAAWIAPQRRDQGDDSNPPGRPLQVGIAEDGRGETSL